MVYKYSPRYSRDLERERIAEAKRNWSKYLTARENKNAYVIAVAIALLIASVLLAVTYFFTPISNQGYMTIYLLDANRKAANYPEALTVNVNSTFSVFVVVENHERQTIDESVLVKVINNNNPISQIETNATQTFNATLKDGETTENVATVSLNQPGNYLVAFELWVQKEGNLQFTGELVALNIQVSAEENATTPTPPSS